MTFTDASPTKVAFTGRNWPIPLSELPTPALTIDSEALRHNVATMAAWCRDAGVDLAPHGKTTMAPDIWRQQIDAGAWGLTVATPYQAEVAREEGVERVILAGTTFVPDALAALTAPGCDVLMWVDSVDAVRLVEAGLVAAAPARPLGVLVEIGAPGGRTGARTIEAALAVVAAVVEADHLVLAGVAGYEGALTHGLDAPALQLVDDYLATMIEFRDRIGDAAFESWLELGGDVVLTAGGSVYFDRVVEALALRHDPSGERGVRTRVVLRSGSYVAHDHDLYRRLTPFHRIDGTERFRPALDLWASVISRPEPTLALLNVGRRDTADDEGLPVVIEAYRVQGGAVRRVEGAAHGAVVTALNDQHAFVSLPAESALAVGDLVRLGISHPCTTLDKWAEIAVIADHLGEARGVPVVTDSICTRF